MKKLVVLFFIAFIRISGYAVIPPGYYNPASGLTGAALQHALHTIIDNHTVLNYTPGVWGAFYSTDNKPDGSVWDMYSDNPNGIPPYVFQMGMGQCYTAGVSAEGQCYSREHSWPKSWFGGEVTPMYTDVFMLVPADLYVNIKRSNYPYGEVGIPTWTSMNGSKLGPSVTPGYYGIVFEPIDEYKGDFARAYFYMETRYYAEDTTWPGSAMAAGSQLLPWAQEMMMQWAQQDSVSQKEIDRNEEVYALQHNRNPFIDYPEYATAIWGNNSGILPEPSNFPASFSAHNIHVQWMDASGLVVPDGYLVRVSSVGFDNIPAPVDGFPGINSPTEKNAPYSLQGVWFTGLNPNTSYYFKLFPYSGSGSSVNYKTDGLVPQVQRSTSP